MPKPTAKNVAKRLLNESMGFGFDDLFPRASQEGGPVTTADGVSKFDLTFHRERGTPKCYRITVETVY